MSNPKRLLALTFLCALSTISAQKAQRRIEPNWDEIENWTRGLRSFHPKNGVIPNALAATRIAEAILKPIYGEQQIEAERPLVAHLRNGVWTVVGTLNSADAGGTAILKISQPDGRVLFLGHGK